MNRTPTWVVVAVALALIAFGGLIPTCSSSPAPTVVSGDTPAPPLPEGHDPAQPAAVCQGCHPKK